MNNLYICEIQGSEKTWFLQHRSLLGLSGAMINSNCTYKRVFML